MEYREEDYLSLSGIQHFIFCRRQWALIHIEQQWEENLRTVEGRLMHKTAHDSLKTETRGDIIITRGLPVFSKELGVYGVCDVVEFHRPMMVLIYLVDRAGISPARSNIRKAVLRKTIWIAYNWQLRLYAWKKCFAVQ